MQAQECPYGNGGETPLPQESAEGHVWGTDRTKPECQTCGGLLGFCPECRQPNRLLSRFCRNCGQAFPHSSWSLAGGEADSALPARSVSLPHESWRSEHAVESPVALLCERGMFLLLGSKGELAAYMAPDPEPYYFKQLLGVQGITHAPALLGGLLLVASEDRLVISDLVELLRQSSSPSRRRVVGVRGKVCAPLATDGKSRLAVLSQEGPTLYLQAFQLLVGRVQLLWTQPRDAGSTPPQLAICGDHLLCLAESAVLYEFSTGAAHAPLGFSEPAGHPLPIARLWDGKPAFYLSRGDGSVYRLWRDQQTSSVQLAPPCTDPLFSWNCSQEDLVLCHGKRLRRVELKTGRLSEMEIPQYCTLAPWVGLERTLVLSQEGSLYAVSLKGTTFQAEKSLKIEGAFHGAALPPVYAGNRLAVCDTRGQLTQVACGN